MADLDHKSRLITIVGCSGWRDSVTALDLYSIDRGFPTINAVREGVAAENVQTASKNASNGLFRLIKVERVAAGRRFMHTALYTLPRSSP